jgi:hypothetical protein
VSSADEDAADAEECVVDVGAAFVAGGEATVAVQPGEAALDDVADLAEAGAVRVATSGDAVRDAA